MISNTSFDIQMNQAQAQNAQNFKKRIANTATGVAAIAVVTCITILIVTAGAQSNNNNPELSIADPSQNLREEIFIDNKQFKQFITLSKKSVINFENISEHIYNLFQQDKVQVERITNLFVKFVFDLIDSNDNDVVDKNEWNAFFNALYPQDKDFFAAWFDKVNNKSSFKIDAFKKFVFDQESKNMQNPPQLKTNPKVVLNNFAKLVIKDNNNYKKTYTFIFNIYDVNGDKIITKDEYIKLLVSLGEPKAKAESEAQNLFKFVQENKIGTADQIKFENWAKFAEAIKPSLIDMLNKNTSFLLKEQLKQQQFVAVLGQSQDIYHNTISMIQEQIDLQVSGNAALTSEQQKILDHLLNTIAQFEFDIVDSNGDKVMTRQEYVHFIDTLFKKQADRQHFYKEFDQINKGQQVTYAQYLKHVKDEVAQSMKDDNNEGDDDDSDFQYQPHEPSKKIGQRLGLYLLENDRNYELTYKFIFNLFDINQDKVVSVDEITGIFKAFNPHADQVEKQKVQIQQFFNGLKQAGVGDGNKVTLDQWTQLAKKIRPELLKQIKQAQFFLQFIASFELKY
ncbi:hypothetical protein ABPG74_011011 [Tetrahymena malaccensis]